MVMHALHGRDGLTYWFNVDLGYPNRWRDEPYLSKIRSYAHYGLSTGQYQTKVQVGKRRWMVLPTKEVEFSSDDYGIAINCGNGEWDYIKKIGKSLDQWADAVSRMSVEERILLLDRFEPTPANDSPLAKKQLDEARRNFIKEMLKS
jgi:hypothetical protein